MAHAEKKPPKRIIFRIQLTPAAKDKLAGLSDQSGITQISLASRMVEWFASQPDTVQAAVLGLYPQEIQEEIAKLILNRSQSRDR